MSCEHGNWRQCELCDALEEKWNAGFASASDRIDKLLLLLRECDATIVMLGGNQSAKSLRAEIAKTIAEGNQP